MLLYGSPRGVNVSGGEWRCVFNTSVFNMAHVRVICFQEGHRFTHLALHIKKEKHTECTVVNQYALAKNEVCYFDSFSLLLLINTESFREWYASYPAQVCSYRLTQNWIPPVAEEHDQRSHLAVAQWAHSPQFRIRREELIITHLWFI